jgi:predicted dehydrogenase
MAGERAIVVGAGGISGAWFPVLKQEGVEVTAVVDLNTEAAEQRIAEYGLAAQAEDSLTHALAKFEAEFVVDLTTPDSHCDVTCEALEAGRHVIGEKPMASSMDEARRMCATAGRAKKLYMVSQSRRWEPEHQVLRDALAEGVLGDLTVINCDFYIGAHFGGFRDEMDSPLILDMSIHHFDLARFFTGLDPVAVYAKEFNPKGSWYRGDAAATAIFEMSNGAVLNYRASWCAEGCHTSWNGDWRFVGENGTILFEKGKPFTGQILEGDEGFHRPTRDIEAPAAPEMPVAMHHGLLDMLRFLREGIVPPTECHDNIRSLGMVFGVIDSSKAGARVSLGS